MAAKKTVGELIKEARTAAGLSQAALAEKVDGVSASDIGKAERGEKELTQAALKQIAKATGVTQKSLLEAPSGAKKTSASSAKKTESADKKKSSSAAKKTESGSAKKTESSSAKKTGSSSAKKTGSSSGTSVKVTAAEKKLLELYRAADSDKKKAAVSILKGETPEAGEILSSLLGGAMEMLGNLGKKDK
ncbi:MAG: helix-turn-helix transcriptional regulator [Oscillospiraceae bacterium]|nr:helix-turn-helix transcriptional regulator [Oscillospiraceae bacterium]